MKSCAVDGYTNLFIGACLGLQEPAIQFQVVFTKTFPINGLFFKYRNFLKLMHRVALERKEIRNILSRTLC